MARFGKQEIPPRLAFAPTSPSMSERSPFLPKGDAPLSKGLVILWGAFMAFVLAGLVIVLLRGRSVPILLEAMSR